MIECIGEGKRWKRNKREGSKEGKTGTVLELSLEVRLPVRGELNVNGIPKNRVDQMYGQLKFIDD